MATQLFLNDSTNLEIPAQASTDLKMLNFQRGNGVVTYTKNTLNGAVTPPTTATQITTTAGGNVLQWVSAPVKAVTIAGTVTFNIRASENNLSANAGITAELLRCDSLGNILSVIAACVVPAAELTTTNAAINWTATPTSTALNSGDRLGVRVYIDDAGGTLTTGFTVAVTGNNQTASASGDSWVQVTETIVGDDFSFYGTKRAGHTVKQFFRNDPTLKSYFPFDNGSGTDKSGNGNNGTLTGQAAGGLNGQGIFLRGRATTDWFDMGTTPSIGTADVTQMWWCAVAEVNNDMVLLYWEQDGATGHPHNEVSISSGDYSVNWGLTNAAQVGVSVSSPANAMRPRTLHHIAITRSATNKVMYIDGKMVGTNTDVSTIDNAITSEKAFGRRDNSTYAAKNYATLFVDELAHFQRALSPTEIAAYYQFATGKVSKSLYVQQRGILVTSPTLTKSLKYTIKATPATLTKSLKYTIDRTASTITKSLKYAIKGTPATLTKSLKYTIKGTPATLTKSLKYTIKRTASTITKGLIYRVRITPSTLTKGLVYKVRATPATLTKSLKYTIKATAATLTKSLKYAMRLTPATLTKSLKYEVRTSPTLTKSLKYTIKTTHSALNNGLIGYWALDENTGTTVADKSGAGHNGTMGGTAPSWVAGQIGSALSFAGGTSYVLMSGVTFPASGSLTAWVYPNDLSSATSDGQVAIASNGDYTGIIMRNGAIQGQIYNSGYHYTSYPATAGAWYQVTLTWDGANTMKLYVNGVLRDTLNTTNAGNPSNFAQLFLSGYGGGGYYNGKLDDVRLYNRVLTPTDAADLYNINNGTQLSLRYAIRLSTTLTKSLKYVALPLITTTTITKGLVYKVRTSPAITRSLKYTIKKTAATLTKSLKYAIKVTPATLTKSLRYAVRVSPTLTKSLKYTIHGTPATLTKSLKYEVRQKMEALVDPFVGSSVDTAKWAITDSTGTKVTEGGGHLSIEDSILPSVPPQDGIKSVGTYTLLGSQAVLEIISPSSMVAQVKFFFRIEDQYTVVGDVVFFSFVLGLVRWAYVHNGSTTQSPSGEVYDAVAHRFLRIRESAGTTYWEKSADGISWTVMNSVANPIAFANVKANIFLQSGAAVATTTFAVLDSFNDIPTATTITKSLKYTVRVTPATLTKSLKYEVRTNPTLTKSLRYEIKRSLTLTKSLKYAVRGALALTKSLKYTIKNFGTTLTKSLRYEVRTSSTLTKSLRYEIRRSLTLTKTLKYTIRGAVTLTKSLKYAIKLTKPTITKSLRYEVKTSPTLTKSLKYEVRHSATITKSLKYVTVKQPIISLSMRYEVLHSATLTKSLTYAVLKDPYHKTHDLYTPDAAGLYIKKGGYSRASGGYRKRRLYTPF